MKAVDNVLPSSPLINEVVLAKDQPEYIPLPVACVIYSHGVKSKISKYRLSWAERRRIFMTGTLWIEQLTFGEPLQPQRPTVFEPLTPADDNTRK